MSTVSSLKPVLDQLADLADCDPQLVVSDPQFPLSALVKRLSLVPDRRKRRGLRHELVVVSALTACAMPVVGSDSVTRDLAVGGPHPAGGPGTAGGAA